MKIAIITWWYAENMGYSENCLPAALADLGHEVHVISSDLQPDFPNYKEAYEPFLGKQLQPCGVKRIEGYTLHRLPHRRTRYGIFIVGLSKCLKEMSPDVIQCFGIPQISTYQSAWVALIQNRLLFLEEHTHLSTIRAEKVIRQRVDDFFVKYIYGPLISSISNHCYAIANDVAEVTLTRFGYSPDKLSIQSLGVDTRKFHPIRSQGDINSRCSIRARFGYDDEDVVFIYTGRFSEDKSPIVLASAIELLSRQGYAVKGLFVGAGSEIDKNAIERKDSCLVVPFVPVSDLPNLYRAADVGVWPKQESTSQLDALACGIPIIVSDRVRVYERVDGCGLMYIEGDSVDLAKQMLLLLERETRHQMGVAGTANVFERFSWKKIAEARVHDYMKALRYYSK